MLRKHFAMSSDIKPDFIITYHAPQHVPFFGGYAKNWVYGYPLYDNKLEIDGNPIKFKVIGDEWNNGVGEWKFKLANSSNRIYNTLIIEKKVYNLYGVFLAGSGFADSYNKFICDDDNNIVDSIRVNNTNTITSVIFGEGLEIINESILDVDEGQQSSCTEITLPKSVTLLTGHLFDKYTSLKSITVPLNVIRIDNLCDINNDSLEEVILKPLTPPDASHTSGQTPLGYYLNDVENSSKIRVYADAIDNYKNDSIWGQYSDLYDTINDTIVYYTDGSRKLYTENLDITSINFGTLPQSIANVHLPNSITNIGLGAFSWCESLNFIEIPNSVNSIGTSAFYGCLGLYSVKIGNSVTSIESEAFSYCPVLNSVVISSIVPPTLGSNVFESTSSDLQIYVPDESVDAYKTATNWSSYASKIKPLSEKPV